SAAGAHLARSSYHVEPRAEKALSIPHRRHVAAQPGIETEAAAGGVQGEEEHDDRKEYVLPRPFSGAGGLVNAEPEVQHEYDAEHADETDPESENERYGEGEFGKKDDGIQNIQIGKINRRHQLAMKSERTAARHLFGPVLQPARDRQRQLPQHSLEPHSAHQHANEPGAEMGARALRWVFLPVLDRNRDARDDETQEQRDEEIFRRTEGVVVFGIADHEIPEIDKRVRHGNISSSSAGRDNSCEAKALNSRYLL